MAEEIDQERRKLIKRIPLIVLASAVPSSVFAHDFDKAKVMKYETQDPISQDGEPLCEEQVIELLGNKYPKEFTIPYTIPYNNKGLEGGFKLTLKDGLVDLLVRIDKENENRLIQLSEVQEGGHTCYSEYEYNLSDRRINYDHPDRMVDTETVPSSIRGFFNGNVEDHEFSFWGQDGIEKRYKIKLKPKKNKDGSLVLVGDIKGAKKTAKKIEIRLRPYGEHLVPDAIDLDYQIDNIPLKLPLVGDIGVRFSKDITLRGVLTDKLDEDLFRRAA